MADYPVRISRVAQNILVGTDGRNYSATPAQCSDAQALLTRGGCMAKVTDRDPITGNPVRLLIVVSVYSPFT